MENTTKLSTELDLYSLAEQFLENATLAGDVSLAFESMYQKEVDRIFDARFFANQSFYLHPIYHKFNFFGQEINTENIWWFYLNDLDPNAVVMDTTAMHMYFRHEMLVQPRSISSPLRLQTPI